MNTEINDTLKAIIDDIKSDTGEFSKIRIFSDPTMEGIENAILESYDMLDIREKNVVVNRIYNKLPFIQIGLLNGSISPSRAREIFRRAMRKMDRFISKYNKYNLSTDVCVIFSTRTANILKRNGYDSVNDLAGIKYVNFMKYSNAGQKSWNEITSLLDQMNIPYVDIEFDYDVIRERINKTISNIIDKYKIRNDIIDDHSSEIQDSITAIMTELLNMYHENEEVVK